MKIIAIGDIHGRASWKLIAHQNQDADEIVFIGDYFDTHEDISPAIQIYNFQEICTFKKANMEKVVMLLGNHDMYIEPYINQSVVSGYQVGVAIAIRHILQENKDLLQMSYCHEHLLFSHAGVSMVWLEENGWNGEQKISEFVNEIWKYKPLSFEFNGTNPYGDNVYQTPIWIRPASLMKANYDTLRNKFIQIVGHTTMKRIDIEGRATGGRYYFIDTLGTSGEYLVWENGIFTTKTI